MSDETTEPLQQHTDVLRRAESLLAESYGGPNAALDPAFIAMLLDIGVTIIKKCLESRNTPATLVEHSRQKTLFARIAARRVVAEKLRDDYGRGAFRHHDGRKVVEALLDAAGKAEPQEIEQLLQEVG